MTIHEKCPKCGETTMPAIEPESLATAARCQNQACGFVLERKEAERG